MTVADDYSPARLADRAQIQDVIYRWCRAIDRLDVEGIRGVFHPDAIDNHGPFVGGVDALIAWLTDRHRGIPFSMHLVSNMLNRIRRAPTARWPRPISSPRCAIPPRVRPRWPPFTGGVAGERRGRQPIPCPGARYIDRFERRGGEWRIARRTVAFDSSMMMDVPPRMHRNSTQTGRSAAVTEDDPIYKERAAMGLA